MRFTATYDAPLSYIVKRGTLPVQAANMNFLWSVIVPRANYRDSHNLNDRGKQTLAARLSLIRWWRVSGRLRSDLALCTLPHASVYVYISACCMQQSVISWRPFKYMSGIDFIENVSIFVYHFSFFVIV